MKRPNRHYIFNITLLAVVSAVITVSAGMAYAKTDPFEAAAKSLSSKSAAMLKTLTDVIQIDQAKVTKTSGDLFIVTGVIGISDIKKGGKKNKSADLMGDILENLIFIGKKLDLVYPVPVEFKVSVEHAEIDAALTMKVVKTWKMTGKDTINKMVGSQFAFKTMDIVFHAKRKVAASGPPEFSVEAIGSMFGKPTMRDPWLGLKPSIEINNLGAITFGGRIYGKCSKEPSQQTQADKCNSAWDVLGLDQVVSKGGTLKLTVEKGRFSEIEAALEKGEFKPAKVNVDGAIYADVGKTVQPGFGVVLKLSKPIPLDQAFDVVEAAKIDGTSKLFKKGQKFGKNIKVDNLDIVVTPTGLSVDPFNYDKPTYHVGFIGSVKGGNGIKVTSNLDTDGDIRKIVAASGNVASGKIEMRLRFADFNNQIRDSLNNVPGIKDVVKTLMSDFKFNGAYVTADVAKSKATIDKGSSRVLVTVMGMRKTIKVPYGDLFDDEKVAQHTARALMNLIDSMPKWLRSGIEKVPGGKQVLGKMTWEGKKLVKYAGNPIDAGRDFGEGVVEVLEDPGGAIESLWHSIF